jgi:hypothetical protein
LSNLNQRRRESPDRSRDSTEYLEGNVVVDLLLQVTRSADNRLSGTVRTISGSETRGFFGTLELMRVFEELVPASDNAAQPAAPGGDSDPPNRIEQ